MSGKLLRTDPAIGGALRRLFSGLAAALAGIGVAFSERRILRWTLLAVAIYCVIWVAVIVVAAAWDARFVEALLWTPDASWWQGLLHRIASVLLYIVFWLAVLVATWMVAMPIVSPIFAFVAEAAECAFLDVPAPPTPALRELGVEAIRSVRRSLLLVGVNVAGAVCIWLVGVLSGLIFAPLGTAVGVVVGGGWACGWVALSSCSYVLENNRVSFADQMRLLRSMPTLMVGFGLVGQLLAILPFTAPFVVVSATVLICRLHRHGHCPLPVRDGLSAKLAAAS